MILLLNAAWVRATGRRVFESAQLIFVFIAVMVMSGFPGQQLVTYLYIGIKRVGVGAYFKNLVPAGLPAWIVPVIFPLEVITFFITRPLTLALRLFGNMFAGHLLLLLFITGGEYMITTGGIGLKIAGAGSFVMAFVLTIFEILIEFLQAYIFTLLAATYIAGSLVDEH